LAENTRPARARTLDAVSPDDAPAPEFSRTMHHLEYRNDIIVNLTFPYCKVMFF